jgi:hypothetical protein
MIYTTVQARKLWIEALRSGEYKQTTATLENKEGYCCLGVACVVAEKHGVVVSHKPNEKLLGGNLNDQTSVMEWLGLYSGEGDNSTGVSLVQMNDDGTTFNDIADFIENNPNGLFITDNIMIYTTTKALRDEVEVDLNVELRYHSYFDGGRDEPSEPAWVEVGDILLHDVDISSELSDELIRDIFDTAQNYPYDD